MTVSRARSFRTRKVPVLHGIGWPGQNRRGVRDEKGSPAVARAQRRPEPTACDRCGSLYARRTWRVDHAVTTDFLERVTWELCPACSQQRAGIGYGRIVLRGPYVARHDEEIRRRIANVARRAVHTQPQRRLLSVDRDGDRIEVLTTSQKLAHRIVKEIKKAFGGRARYVWSSRDGSLQATWSR